MRAMFLKGAVLFACAALAVPMAGCTPTDEQQAIAGITAVCDGAAIGASVVVDVAAPGSVPKTVGTAIETEGAKACPSIVAAVQKLIEGFTANGQVATATVTVTQPNGAVSLKRRVRISRRATAPGAPLSYQFTVMPGGVGGNPFKGLPILGDL